VTGPVRLLVTGARGYLGGVLVRAAAHAGWQVVGTYHRSGPGAADVGWVPLDVTDPVAVTACLATVRPAAVVHLAAVTTDPDPGRVWRVTAEGAAHVARAASVAGARLVHVSSDAVHAGRAEPYDETVPPRPVHLYGAAKAAAEVAVLGVAPAAAVVRSSLVISPPRGPMCPQETLARDLVGGRAAGHLFTDEIRCPVIVDDLCAALLELAASDFAGVLNVAGPDAVSRYDLGVAYARLRGLDPAAIPAGTLAGSGVVRPGVVRLDTALARRSLRTPLRGASALGPVVLTPPA
jgi:dTDP-4-dehydrorhamnose reductase